MQNAEYPRFSVMRMDKQVKEEMLSKRQNVKHEALILIILNVLFFFLYSFRTLQKNKNPRRFELSYKFDQSVMVRTDLYPSLGQLLEA